MLTLARSLSILLGCAIVVFAMPRSASAQEVTPEPSPPARVWAYGDVGGPGILYSANVEYQPFRALSFRVGGAALPICLFDRCGVVGAFPISAQTFVGGERHHLELGVGALLTTMADDDARFWTATVGYRYAQPAGGFLFRAHLNVLSRMNDMSDVLPWPGVSFGYGW